jgi:hypothetical protein
VPPRPTLKMESAISSEATTGNMGEFQGLGRGEAEESLWNSSAHVTAVNCAIRLPTSERLLQYSLLQKHSGRRICRQSDGIKSTWSWRVPKLVNWRSRL